MEWGDKRIKNEMSRTVINIQLVTLNHTAHLVKVCLAIGIKVVLSKKDIT